MPTQAKEIKSKIDWMTWVYNGGLAPIKLDFTTKSLNDSFAIVDDFVNNPTMNTTDAKSKWDNEFKSTTKTIFTQKLNTILSTEGLTMMNATTFDRIDNALNVTGEENPEIRQQWEPLGIMVGKSTTVARAKDTVSTIGRMKYLSPVYDALLTTTFPITFEDGSTKPGKQVAQEWFQLNYDFYSPYA
jgi:hypothetical protein